MKILICEDDNSLQNALRLKLDKFGYNVVLADNGKEAIQQFDSDPDIILLDLTMPVLDGEAVLQEMKRKNISIPVVIVTNNSYTDERVNRIKAEYNNVTHFYVKSNVTIDELMETVLELEQELIESNKTIKQMSDGSHHPST